MSLECTPVQHLLFLYYNSWPVCGSEATCTAAYTGLTDGANLLFDLIGHGLVKVLELHTQSKVSQLDGAIG